MSVSFIHAADLHLGSRLNTVGVESDEMQKRLQTATYTAFENIVEACIEEDTDFLVISGDIYDEDSRSVKANQFLAEQMKKLQEEGIEAYIIHGNHDPMGKGEDFVDMPDNVHVFSSEEAEAVNHSEEVEILGQSYRSRHERRKMVPGYDTDSSKISIGLLHTELDPDNDDYVPVSIQDLQSKDVEYWALGHIHQTRVYEDNLAAYPGIPQGRHIEEKDVGGCLKIEIDDNGTPKLEFIPVSPLSWREEEVDLENGKFSKKGDIERRIEEKVNDLEANYEEIRDLDILVKSDDFELNGFIYRWFLTGHTEIHDQLQDENTAEVLKQSLREKLGSYRPFVWTEEIKVRTRPPLPDIDDVEDNEVIQGFEQLVEEIENDSDLREELKDESGMIWKETSNKDRVKEGRLALTDEKFDELVSRAEKKLKDELLRRTV